MKIRNGFVSNSSSSSFILAYDKNSRTNDPKKIVDILRKDPNVDILIKGWDLNEGYDFFNPDEEQASLIRRFADRFIGHNTGNVTRQHYEMDLDTGKYEFINVSEPAIEAYTDYVFWNDPYEYRMPDVDMSDMECPNLTLDEIMHHKDDPEVVKKIALEDEYNKIKSEREKKAKAEGIEKTKEEMKSILLRHGAKEEDIVYEEVQKDNNSTEYTSDFIERYMTNEYLDDYVEDHISPKRGGGSYYAVIFDEVVTNKEEILKTIGNGDSDYICWTNPIFNYYENRKQVNIEFYQIGEEEAKCLKESAFLKANNECRLYVNTRIVEGIADIKPEDVGKKIDYAYGNVVVIGKGEDLIDFKKNANGPEECSDNVYDDVDDED